MVTVFRNLASLPLYSSYGLMEMNPNIMHLDRLLLQMNNPTI